ncbi:MAG TPA: hypothetical protein VMP67_06605, partial [Candidatus Limnocylindria bacterium]|nr:hypothetical protein [Candidatus Limnocylindria bacterium]
MRKRVRAALALAIIAALLMVPLQAFAAKGKGLAAEAATLTPQTATGQLLAFQVGFHNSGKSTISHFRFDGTVSGGATFHPASSSPCAAASGGVSCDLGNLPSGAAVQLVLVFNAPASPGSVTLSGGFNGDADNGTPGAKDDQWAIPNQTVSVLQSSSEFFGTYELTTAP